MTSLHVYAINLDRAPERWAHVERSFANKAFVVHRISAVDGRGLTLPSPDFDLKGFRRLHGRVLNIFELACSLSHVKALNAFLASEEEYALICEDDIFFDTELEALLAEALTYSASWNVLRLTGLSDAGIAFPLKKLIGKYSLFVEFGRLKGGAAYLIDKKAAAIFVQKLLPMRLPWDHAFDREWVFGLKALSIRPFPISQTDEKFKSSIQTNSQPKLSSWRRCLTTYPYQAFNEVSRSFFRSLAVLSWKVGR